MSNHIRAGALNRYVSVQQPIQTRAADGSVQDSWQEIKKIYVGINPLSGREVLMAQQLKMDISHQITARFDDALWSDPKAAAKLRIVYGARIFNVRALLNLDEDDRVVQLASTEGANDG